MMMPARCPIDRISVAFVDDNAVADAGLLAVSALAGRLGLESAADQRGSMGHRPGRKLSSLVTSMVAGGDCIDDVDALRAGATQSVLSHDLVAASRSGRGCGA